MADEENILGGKLSLEDNYSSALSRFANRVLGAENRFKQFADKVTGSNNKIGANLSKSQRDVDKLAQTFIEKGNSVANAINKANKIVEGNQERTIDGLTKKYLKLGMTIQDAYSKAQQESNHIWNGDSKPTGSNDGIKDFAESFLSGGFGGMIGKLGLIGTGVMATVSILKKIDGAMDTGFGILNKLSGNMFSYEGIKQSLSTAMDYQSTRAKLDLFYGSKEEGESAYKLASKVALNTFADTQSLAEAMSIMKKNNVDTDEEDLYTFLDMVGARGEGTTSKEVGLAIEDAMNGEWERLKEYSITTTKLKKYLEELKKTDKATYKELKNTFNKQGSVTDPQKAYKLIMNYVRNSPINGYAEQYAKTAQGSLDNLTGLWEQIKVSIMGLDDAGNVIEGSALFHFSEMVNNLKETLGSDSATKGFGEISKGIGEGFKAFGEAFDDVLEKTDWEKVGEAIADSIGIISDALINLVDSGALQDLADNLPNIIEMITNNKFIDATSDIEIGSNLANGNFVAAGESFLSKLYDKGFNFLGIKDKKGNTIRTNKDNAEFDSEHPWISKAIDTIYDATGMGIPYRLTTEKLLKSGIVSGFKFGDTSNMITDSQISNMIKNSDISDVKKANLKEIINSDDLGSYNIHIEHMEINSDNIDDWINQLKQAQANRR